MSHFHLANLFALPQLRKRAPESIERAREGGADHVARHGLGRARALARRYVSCLPHLDLLFMNQDEARMLSGSDDPEQAARRMQALGASDVVIKLGAEGCAVYTQHSADQFPGFKVDVVDTTGAGDCFAGGFLAGLSRGASYAEAARFANAVGALSVQKLGAINGICTVAETEEWLGTAINQS